MSKIRTADMLRYSADELEQMREFYGKNPRMRPQRDRIREEILARLKPAPEQPKQFAPPPTSGSTTTGPGA